LENTEENCEKVFKTTYTQPTQHTDYFRIRIHDKGRMDTCSYSSVHCM